ncbi:cell wall protein DAN4-like isoform X2 [Echeneis naucrates]|uniref:cell wall protein DAN4-like isoform X2 n=1 Tax=Echeneis naucrates TaxID=173247 RepID=UPI00111332D5|nr:cell wall protein DAN4-like isoform X2 [Echeneis naucrates]
MDTLLALWISLSFIISVSSMTTTPLATSSPDVSTRLVSMTPDHTTVAADRETRTTSDRTATYGASTGQTPSVAMEGTISVSANTPEAHINTTAATLRPQSTTTAADNNNNITTATHSVAMSTQNMTTAADNNNMTTMSHLTMTTSSPNRTHSTTNFTITTTTNTANTEHNITSHNSVTPIKTTVTPSTETIATRTETSTAGSPVPISPAAEGVPGWGIALLVLAALVLLLLLLLLVALMVWCCCCRGGSKGFSPYDQLTHRDDIPLYTTHSRFDNGGPKTWKRRQRTEQGSTQ